MTEALRAAKDGLREQVAARMAGLPDGMLAVLSGRACTRLAALDEFRSARRVLLYAPLPDEVDTRLLMEAVLSAGAELYLPVCRPHVCDMDAIRVAEPGRDLIRRHFGILAPRPGLPVARPEDIDLVVVPGRAFDRAGRRGGRGWGTYDHFLVRAGDRLVRIGLALDLQVFPAVPAGRYDQCVGLLVTESAAVRCGR
jgi:5-formyltetrahydrofolate cyclo-ligase